MCREKYPSLKPHYHHRYYLINLPSILIKVRIHEYTLITISKILHVQVHALPCSPPALLLFPAPPE